MADLSGTAEELVRWARVGRLATVDSGGVPHVVPVSPVLDDGKLYFATDEATAKVRNLKADPGVAIVFDEYTEVWTELKGVLVQGRAEILGSSGPRWEKYRDLLYAKYLQYEPHAEIVEGETVIVEVTIDHVVTSGL